MWLFALFIIVPLIEIALFIQVGGWLTLWPTLAIVVVTAALGAWLARLEGARTLRELQTALDELRDPATPLAHGAMILFAGALLLTPGFLTDAVGFALLVPPLRSALLTLAIRRGVFERSRRAPPGAGPGHARRPPRGGPGHAPKRPDIIEGEFEAQPEPPRDTDTSGKGSGWTRH